MGYVEDYLEAMQPRAKKRGREEGDYIPDEQAQSQLSSLAKNIGGAVQSIGMALDTPGAIARGVLAGKPTSGFSWDADTRVTGEELLQEYGFVDKDTNPFARTAAGLATEIATDPLTWASGGLSALGRGGRAAEAANLLDLAPKAATARMGRDAAAKTLTGSYTANAYKALGAAAPETAENLAVRPLLGQRYSQATTTVRELAEASDDPKKAIEALTNQLSRDGLTFEDVAEEKLGGLFGFGFINSNQAYTPAGGEYLLDAMDLVGQKIGWSYPARVGSALFDERVAGRTDELGQMMAMKHFGKLDSARAAGERAAAAHAMTVTDLQLSPEAQQMLGADSLLSEEGNNLLTRLYENKPTARDVELQKLVPGLDKAVDSWDKIRRHNVDSAKRLGIAINEYEDEFGVRYSPRTGSEFEFEEYGEGIGRSLYNTRTENAFGRSAGLIVPGGTDDLREISKLPIVREHAQLGEKSPYTQEQVGQAIKEWVDAKHGPDMIDNDRATGLARIMYRLKKDLPDGTPAFAEHPINLQARNIVAQEMARANAGFVYDSIAEVADQRASNAIPGGGFKTAKAAIEEIASKVGLQTGTGGELSKEVADNVRQRIASKFGTTPDKIDLGNVAIPEKTVELLSAMQDFYAKPRAQEEVVGYLDQFTQLTKSFLLAWPSRHVRDATSNAFSLWLKTGNAADALKGIEASQAILAGDWAKAVPILRELPQYSRLATDDDVRRAFILDGAGNRITSGLTQTDYLTSAQQGDVSRLVPGAQPMTLGNALSDLVPTGERGVGGALQDFGTIKGISDRYSTQNPVLNASAKINDFNDSLFRIGGMIALMRQGVDPARAAQEIKDVLVDYGSSTVFEREVAKKIFPWWAYNSKIGKFAVTELINNPGGRYGQSIRGLTTLQASDDETYVPSSLRQKVAFRVPENVAQMFGKQPGQNTTTFLNDLEFVPGVDTLSLVAPGSYEDTLSNFASQANPFIKTFMEGATGRDVFTKRPLKETEGGADRIYKFLSGDQRNLSPAAKAVVNNIPGLQRPLNFVGGMLDSRIPDPRQRLAKQAFNATTGMKLTDVDPAWMWGDVKRQLSERTDDYTREYTTTYVPDELEQQAPPELLDDIQLMNYADKQYREYAKTRPRRQPIYNPLLDLIGLGQ